MTHKKWIKLSPQEQQIKIAEHDEWTDIRCHIVGEEEVLYGWHPTIHPKAKYKYETPLPKYLEDLNAMHKVEKLLPDEAPNDDVDAAWWGMYESQLICVAGTNCRDSIRATAAQRAEAFILTMEPENE